MAHCKLWRFLKELAEERAGVEDEGASFDLNKETADGDAQERLGRCGRADVEFKFFYFIS